MKGMVILLLVAAPGTLASFLVQLSNTTTLARFLGQHPHIEELVASKFSFGDFHGFSAALNKTHLRSLRNSIYVKAISPDIQVGVEEIQIGAPRHLSRISRRQKLPFHPIDYYYTPVGQENVDVYIIDTGIYADHSEFEGRVIRSVDFTGEGSGDRNGHGTHVAGIVGSKTFGAAKKVNLVEIKVLTGDGTGNLSTVISGIDHAVNDHKQHGKRKAVANLSLGATFNTLLNSAVNAAVDSGLPMIVAAGNTNSAACITSPASATNAITVGAIDDRYDTIASFSNWGSCVTVFASGVYVMSVSHLGATNSTMSGTSMASPAVAGTIAMFMGAGDTAEEAVEKVTKLATPDAIDIRSTLIKPRSPNLIAYNGHDLAETREAEGAVEPTVDQPDSFDAGQPLAQDPGRIVDVGTPHEVDSEDESDGEDEAKSGSTARRLLALLRGYSVDEVDVVGVPLAAYATGAVG